MSRVPEIVLKTSAKRQLPLSSHLAALSKGVYVQIRVHLAFSHPFASSSNDTGVL